MRTCPACSDPLSPARLSGGAAGRGCTGCGGLLVAYDVLQRHADDRWPLDAWEIARFAPERHGPPCPACGKAMAATQVDRHGLLIHVDVCVECRQFWFEQGELAQVGLLWTAASRRAGERGLPPEVALATMRTGMRSFYERARTDPLRPDARWKWLPGLLGLPVVDDGSRADRWPWATTALTALLIAVFLATWSQLEVVAPKFGFVPAETWRRGGLTLVTSFFLHAGLGHLIGNAWFLVSFGRYVERELGHWRFLLLLLLSTILGDLAHSIAGPESTVPAIGASGGIWGIITFFAVCRPRALVSLWFLELGGRWIHPRAIDAWLLWLGYELLCVPLALADRTDVATFAHLGGLLPGLAYGILWRVRQRGA